MINLAKNFINMYDCMHAHVHASRLCRHHPRETRIIDLMIYYSSQAIKQ